ncbi:diguanylate cyclase [Paenibacillus sp. 19GGS1-52]|uniref:diguanylate cyclase n=1 Tax=Paenibacillus sp. 19GGS1-52 TaxID=2758563 RepID=UPI001EFB22C9|nr:diguanylate cyclase [Paenibacillus sp. 19GGS1-52]ULO07857.1 diguanylate cyclase [Paenibacillus sp. 19GGS1-52]
MMMIDLIASLFANFCILVTFVFFSGRLAKKYAFLNGTKVTPLAGVSAGILFGLFGLILMSYSYLAGPGTYVNLLHLTIVIMASYLGWLPTLVCAFILAICRVIFYDSSYNSVVTAIALLLYGILCSWISVLPWSRLRKMMVGNLLWMGLFLALLLHTLGSLSIYFYPIQFIISISAVLIVYYIAEHIQRSNDVFTQLEVRATTDYLTGLNNLQQFHRHLEIEMTQAERHQECLSLLAIDIDHFKIINDTYGHPAGDEVLRQLTRRLCQHSRSHDIVSRNGGEEFTVLLPDCPLLQAKSAAERLRKAVENELFLLPSDNSITITVSIGLACYPETVPGADGRLLVQSADQALYHAKNTGRNKVSINSPASDSEY